MCSEKPSHLVAPGLLLVTRNSGVFRDIRLNDGPIGEIPVIHLWTG